MLNSCLPAAAEVIHMDSNMNVVRDAANRIATKLDADVLVFNGLIWRHHSEEVIEVCNARNRRKNIFLILTTPGGDPHAAYRIARTLQQHYEKFIAYVPGYCKSAGTLLALGAHELVMTPHAELGPVDLQVPHSDEVGMRSSVLTSTDALRVLQTQAINSFIKSFIEFRTKAQLPTRLAAEMAATLVAGLYNEVFSQVDPMRLGEFERANKIAIEYGERLISVGKNAKDGTLIKPVGAYPSHMFVIDQVEARELFVNIRNSTPDERLLETRNPLSEDKTFIVFFNSTPEEVASHEQENRVPEDGKQDNGGHSHGDGVVQGKPDVEAT